MKEWFKFTKSKNFPKDIPLSVHWVYKKQFEGFNAFLGNNYKTYDEAKKYAQSLKLKGQKEWFNFSKTKNFPIDIPKRPDNVYKDFEGYTVFLNTKILRPSLGEVTNKSKSHYIKVKKFALSLNLKTKKEWHDYVVKNKIPIFVPRQVFIYFKKRNLWESWGKFLGTGNIKGTNQHK